MKTRQFTWEFCTGVILAVVIFFPLRGQPKTQSTPADLRVEVVDENGEPVPRVEIVVRLGSGTPQTIYTDTAGRFEVHAISSSQVHLSLSKPGFFRIDDRVLDLAPGVNEVTLTLNHETELQEKLEVKSQPVQINPHTPSHQESLVEHDILRTPFPA